MDNLSRAEDLFSTQSEPEFYTYSPSKVIEAVRTTDDSVLVDFDETLWLRNSTEEFLASVSPRFLASLLLQFLGLLKPWLWFSRDNPEMYRDLIRVKTILFFFPHAVRSWNEMASKIGPKYLNKALFEALTHKPGSKIKVVSYGYDFIIEPLLTSIGSHFEIVVGATVDSASRLRRIGKAKAIMEALGDDAIEKSVFVTDSLLDEDVLCKAKYGILCKWPEAKFVQAGLSPMLPLVYTKKIKRPKEKYFTRAILGHDYLLLILVFALSNPNPVVCAVTLLLFVLAFFSIYEIGYYENDLLGEKYEDKPVVSSAFLNYGHNFKPWFAWVCGMTLALPASIGVVYYGIVDTTLIQPDSLTSLFNVWLGFGVFMLGVMGIFYYFNRVVVSGRFIPMLFLQMARNCGALILFSTSLAGALFCFCWALGRWIPYVIYRFGGRRRDFPNHAATCLLFIGLLMVMGIGNAAGFDALYHWHTALILLYTVLRATKDMWKFRSYLKPVNGG